MLLLVTLVLAGIYLLVERRRPMESRPSERMFLSFRRFPMTTERP